MKMEIDLNRAFYLIGTGLLVIAIFDITVLPCILYKIAPSFIVPSDVYKRIVGGMYALSFISYLFCEKYFLQQVQAIVSVFLFFCLFQIILQQIW